MDSPRTPQTLRSVLAQNVRLARTRRGWSQERLAERAEVHRTYIGAVERGERSIGLDNLERIAAALGVSASQLLDAALWTSRFDVDNAKS